MTLDHLLNSQIYPLGNPGSTAYKQAVTAAQTALADDGCAVLKGFIQRDALRAMSEEIITRKSKTHFSHDSINPYFHTRINPDYPTRHPLNTFLERSSGFIPGDAWEAGSINRTIFEHPSLSRFLADCLGLEALYPYSDPLAGLTSNILDPGQQFTWHFDTNEFAVTILVDAAEQGGLFEYVPSIRSAEAECFDAVQDILEGGRAGVRTLNLEPGDLQIFRGRHSLHRVTRVAPESRPRHAAIFAYTEQNGVIGRVERTQQLFGRVLPEHLAAEKNRVRSDSLID
jgi:hypothetical protein